MKNEQYFKDHPSRLEVFQTSDGFLFPLESDAKNHQRSVDKDKAVKRYQNPRANTEPATETVAVVEKVIGEDENGNIVSEKSVATVETVKATLSEDEPVQDAGDVDKAADVAVQDTATKEVKIADNVTGKETATVQAKSKTAKAATKKAQPRKAIKLINGSN